MNLALIKLGARISFESQGTSGGTGETLSIIRMLAKGGAHVTALTKIIRNESSNPIDNVKVANVLDYADNINGHNFDALIIMSGTVNFFGGAENPDQIANYKLINKFKGPVFYIYCDPLLTFRQIWPAMAKKEWASKYKESDIVINRNDIIFISQAADLEYLKNTLITKDSEIKPSKFIHYPFEKFPFVHDYLEVNSSPLVDLSYGGTMRGGKREKRMVDFYFDYPTDIKVEMFGKITKEDFRDKYVSSVTNFPDFTKAIAYDKMHEKMNEALAHIVIGDDLYYKIETIGQRASECVVSNVVTFFDKDVDPTRRFFNGNKELSDFLYIKNKEEAIDKIRYLKSDNLARLNILETQRKSVNFDSSDYCKGLVDIILKNS